jgi:uncharacterized beta barrel domain-containing protein DUF5777
VTRVLSGWTATFGLCLLLLAPASAHAQNDDPAALKPAEPDFTLVGLPTSLRLPTFRSSFRVTHRFTRPLNDDFGDVFADFFGIDSGAVIGLEYRFGIVKNGQIGILRNNNRTIQFMGQYSVLRQGSGSPVDISAIATIEGTNNFKDSYSPALGAIVSRTIGTVAALYVEPIWVNNTNSLPKEVAEHNNTFMVGVGARVRIRPTVYIVGEVAPRSGNTELSPGQDSVSHGSIAIEKRAGGHMFQINFSNAFGTTMANIARGGGAQNDWYLGFNISRKFF